MRKVPILLTREQWLEVMAILVAVPWDIAGPLVTSIGQQLQDAETAHEANELARVTNPAWQPVIADDS